MSRLTGWLTGGKHSTHDSSLTPDEEAAKERDNLQHALEATGLIMNDDIDGAWQRLQQGDSSFHDMGSALTFFMRSVLGFEKQVMVEASSRLAECETRAWADLKRAQKRSTVIENKSSIYPPGTEYRLITAQSQLMGAVVGILHESLVEGMRSFYRLRKAYTTLDAIIAVERKELERLKRASTTRLATPSTKPVERPTTDDAKDDAPNINEQSTTSNDDDDDDNDDDDEEDFVDAKEIITSGTQTPTDASTLTTSTTTTTATATAQTTPERDSFDAAMERSRPPTPLPWTSSPAEEELVLTDPVDIFIHSGANMCFGVILLILSLIPPALSRILSVVGFHGDRASGVRMLWRSAAHPNMNGAVAALTLLAYYNGMLGAVDILPDEREYDEAAESVGPPTEKCAALLGEMRARYPDSGLWKIQDAVMHVNARNVRHAAQILQNGEQSKMKQVAALSVFEQSLESMLLQDWPMMRDGFLRCVEMNDWSTSFYYYMAGCASLELYRDAYHAGDESEARVQRAKATGYLQKAPTVSGKKRVMAKQMPLETFLQYKIQRWEARAKEQGVDFVDAIGLSPALEMIYIWNGQKKMSSEELEKGIANSSWDRCTAEKAVVDKIKAEDDEMGAWAVCNASLLKGQRKWADARSLLEEKVMQHDRSVFKGHLKNDYIMPSAIYELASLAWAECCNPPASDNSEETVQYRKSKLEECSELLNKAKAWESYVLDTRMGMRVASGLETLAWFRDKMDWH